MSSDSQPARPGADSLRFGAGLLAGLFLGRGSLIAAATGQEQFELAIGHFVLVVLVCLLGIALIGVAYERLMDAQQEDEIEDDADTVLSDETQLVPLGTIPDSAQQATESPTDP